MEQGIKSLDFNLAKLDRRLLWTVITLTGIDIGVITAALIEQSLYYTLRTPVILLTIAGLISCFTGYLVNKKYLEQPD